MNRIRGVFQLFPARPRSGAPGSELAYGKQGQAGGVDRRLQQAVGESCGLAAAVFALWVGVAPAGSAAAATPVTLTAATEAPAAEANDDSYVHGSSFGAGAVDAEYIDAGTVDAGAEAGSARLDDGNLSLDFQDIEVRAALQLIAEFCGFNLVVSDSVAGRITLRLEDVPWEQALALILKMRGLGQWREGDVLLVAPAEEVAARKRLEYENTRALADLEPLGSAFIQVRYAKAAHLFELFAASAGEGSLFSPRGRVIVDERTNAIILTDTAANIEAFRQVIGRLDVPVRQVLIESRIVTTSNNASERLGIRWGGGAVTNNGRSHIRYGGSLATLGELHDSGATEPGGIGLSYPEGLVVDLGVSRSGASSFGVGITGDGYLVDLEISALAAEGFAEVVARPQVVTADRTAAVIESGVEIPYQEATSSGATSTAFKDAVLSLQVTPQITADDRIVMQLDVKQDTVGQIFNGIPSINTNRIRTEVLVDDGQTVVLGGIFQKIRNRSKDKTPLLGDVPHLGRLFRRDAESEDEQELLVFVTPSILKEQSLNSPAANR